MKPRHTIALCLAALIGFVLGSTLHPFPVRAGEARPTEEHPLVYVQGVGSGLSGAGVTAMGHQIVGFSCVQSGAGPNPAINCYVASVK